MQHFNWKVILEKDLKRQGRVGGGAKVHSEGCVLKQNDRANWSLTATKKPNSQCTPHMAKISQQRDK